MSRLYFVYILSSRSRQLYVGITSNIISRLQQHRSATRGFTARYRIGRLVHLESTPNVRAAIDREKQLKGWSRAKKIALIASLNPAWNELAEGWFGETTADPSLRSG